MDLVTGATGFIGRALALRLVAMGRSVCTLGRRPCGIPGVTEDLVVANELETAGPALLRGRKFEHLYHLASYGVDPQARDPRSMRKINVEFPHELILALAPGGFQAGVFAGSSAEYAAGLDGHRLLETDALETRKLYGASKAAGSLLIDSTASVGAPIAQLRVFQVFGPGEAKHRLLPHLIAKLISDERVALSPGEQLRDFLYVADVVDAFILAAQCLAQGRLPSGIYNIGSGNPTSVRSFAELVARAMQSPLHNLGIGDLDYRPDDVPFIVSGSQSFTQATGWQPKVSLDEGIKQTLLQMVEQ